MTYVLVPGAGGEAWYWHPVVERLERRGDDVVAPDLPTGDPDAGLRDYAAVLTAAAGDRERVTVVALSMGAYAASLAALDVVRYVLVAPMIPAPQETANEWWTASGLAQAGAPPFDPFESFFHDAPEAIRAEARRRPEAQQADKPMREPWPLPKWPDVPTRVLAGRYDRLFPYPFMQRLALERLGVTAEPLESGHLPALSRPDELTAAL